MGRTRLPAHIRRLVPDEHRERRKRLQDTSTGHQDLLKAHGAESELELILLNRLERAGLPLGVPQLKGIDGRRFKFDRAWPAQRVAVDVHGATFVKGGHSTGLGIESDCIKACLAAIYGWRYLPVTKHMIEDGRAVELIARALGVTT